MKNTMSTIRVSFIILTISILLGVSFQALAQKTHRNIGPVGRYSEDTSINPHDFVDKYYFANGVNPKLVTDRRTGTDLLSVFGETINPYQSRVRVLVTLPAYDEFGQIMFWYPLGNFDNGAFTQDTVGIEAMEAANAHAIYVFPNKPDWAAFTDTRQAALIEKTRPFFYEKTNPLGLRMIVFVTYTEKAFSKDGFEMMSYLGKKNGYALDGTPIIKSRDDLDLSDKEGLISMQTLKNPADPLTGSMYAVTPVIDDPTNGAIARDAFLVMATNKGLPLPSEEMFWTQFNCLKKTGSWCN